MKLLTQVISKFTQAKCRSDLRLNYQASYNEQLFTAPLNRHASTKSAHHTETAKKITTDNQHILKPAATQRLLPSNDIDILLKKGIDEFQSCRTSSAVRKYFQPIIDVLSNKDSLSEYKQQQLARAQFYKGKHLHEHTDQVDEGEQLLQAAKGYLNSSLQQEIEKIFEDRAIEESIIAQADAYERMRAKAGR